MGILNWLFGKQDDGKLAEPARTIASLQQELDALRRQEEMNRGNREEINRLHRQINDMKYGPTVKQQMAEMSYDELLEEAKRRRLLKQDTPKPVQREAKPYHGRTAPSRARTSTTPSSPSTYHDTMTPVVIATMLSSSSSGCSSSDSGSSGSSSDGGSCDSGGGF